MSRVLVAWELGGNLGHLTRLRPVAERMQARGHSVSWAVRDVVAAGRLLGAGERRGRLYQAPLALNPSPRQAWTMADVLLSCGYAGPDGLAALTEGWLSVFDASGCDVVLADHAPTALLAARAAGLRAVHIGHGFTVPPRVSPLPVFRDWVDVDPAHAQASDTRVLRSVNTVLRGLGAPPLARLCDLFYPQHTLLCTWPELDHYRGVGRHAGDYCGPDGEYVPGHAAAWPPGYGPHVLVYLRRSHPATPTVLKALATLGLPTLCYLPGEGEAPVQAPTLRYSHEPIDLKQVLPRASLVVCHAGQATVAQGLRLGIPALMLPEHAEQHLLARQVERSGAGLNFATLPQPVDVAALIERMTGFDDRHARAARQFAQTYGADNPAALSDRITNAVVA